MQNIFEVIVNLLMTLATVVLITAVLVGFPKLDYVGNSQSAWSGEYPIRLLPILFHFESDDPILCFEGAPFDGCLREKLLTGALFDELSEESTAGLVRNTTWLVWCSALLVLHRIASFFRVVRQIIDDLAAEIPSWVPTHAFWLMVAMTVAYGLSLF